MLVAQRNPEAPHRWRRLRYALFFLKTNPPAVIGLGIIAAMCIAAVVAPWVVPYDPETPLPGKTILPPSASHWFGTDKSGLDVFSRVISGARTDLPIAVIATAIAMVGGVALGVVTGYFGDRRGLASGASELVLRALDVLQAFPVFVLALTLVAAAGPSAFNVGAAITFVAMPAFVRLVRGQVLGLRQAPFVEAARCAGARPLRVAFRHILPTVLAPALVQASITVGFAVILTAGLSFVGAGVTPPTPEWGLMISAGAENVNTGQWWIYVFPGLALALTVFGFALAGEAFGRIVDPTRRR